ncbi:hypothetical protein WSM22_26660 [Cytophagales bacterium WSM2-2]|nr:hypothetical protein WSM22_26660 [Cytophagales bacterium WSM2-2]
MSIRSYQPTTQAIRLTVLFWLAGCCVSAQGDPLSLDDAPKERTPIKDAFNGPHLILGNTTTLPQAHRLDFVLTHRFGKFEEGPYNLWGFDESHTRLGFEYGVNNVLAIGTGRTSLGKNFDLYVKYRPLVQTTGGDKNVPVSVMLFFSGAFSHSELRRQNDIYKTNQFVNQLVYTFQSAISRQFSKQFAAQITGSVVHRNSVPSSEYSNDMYGVGFGARLKVSSRINLMTEYHHMFNQPSGIYNPVAVGGEIAVGGHVFNLHVTNSVGSIEKDFLTATTDSGLRFGFMITRMFMLKPTVKGGKMR